MKYKNSLYMHDRYPGEWLMLCAIAAARDWQRNMASPQIFVCWL